MASQPGAVTARPFDAGEGDGPNPPSQPSTRSRRKKPAVLFESPSWPERHFEPGLPAALAALSLRQR